MTVKFKEVRKPGDNGITWKPAGITVSEESHMKIQEISARTGLPMREVSEMLIQYALKNVEWE